MQKLFHINFKIMFVSFMILDVFCVGLGMGVPIFCILFGFVVGWYLVKKLTLDTTQKPEIFRKVFNYGIMTSLFTFGLMMLIWGKWFLRFFDPQYDFRNTGIPMILYDPKISLIGWLVLMIFISPFLQLLTTMFSAYVMLLSWLAKKEQRV